MLRDQTPRCDHDSVRNRAAALLAAVIVGGTFVAGLVLSGRLGGGLLLITDAILIALTRAVWSQLRPQGRPLRIALIVLIAALAAIKLAS